MEEIQVGDMATWRNWTSEGWVVRRGRVTRKLTPEVWEVCGNFGVKFINPTACEIRKVEDV